MLGILYAAIALVLMFFFIPFGILAAFLDQSANPEFLIGGGIGIVVMAIIMPVVYGIFGFVGGAISAFIYNLVAKVTGGLEFTFEDVTPKSYFPANADSAIETSD